MARNKLEIAFVLFSHLFPFYGLFVLGWNPYAVALIYSIETLIMLFFFEALIITRVVLNTPRRWRELSGIGFIPPVLIFCSVHIMFATLMFGTSDGSLEWDEMTRLISGGIMTAWSAIALMLAQYLYSFFLFLQSKAYLIEDPGAKETGKAGGSIIKRVFFMQFTIIVGGSLAMIFHSPQHGIAVLILLQVLFTLVPYLKKRKE